MAKKKLFKTKNIGKEIMPAIGQTASATAGYTLGKIVENKIVEKKPEAQKIIGPAAFILGTAVTALTDEGNSAGRFIKAAGIGLAASGGYSIIDKNVPDDTKRKIGLSGIGETGSANGKNDDVFDEIAAEAEAEVEQELLNEPEPETTPEPQPEEEPENIAGAPVDNSDNETDDIVDNLID